MLTCAVMSAVLASATISRTGSSLSLPSKVILPRVKANVLPRKSTLPQIRSSDPFMAGAALVPVITSLSATRCRAHVRARKCTGMSILMSRVAGSAGGSARGRLAAAFRHRY